MGTYVRLSLLPAGINQQEWEKVYEESLQLLKAFQFADIKEKEYFSTTIPVYVQATERKELTRYWQTCGDLKSKRYAETFKLCRDVSVYQTSVLSESGKDILLGGQEQNIANLFDSKTQGYEYHLYILAIAMLFESRFPESALVEGDFDYKQCIKAKEWADEHLSLPINIPVRVNVEGLLSRFKHLKNEFDGIEVVEKWLIADQEEKFEIIFNYFSKEAFLYWFSKKIKVYSSPNQLGALKLIIFYLNTVKNLDSLIHIACKNEDGPHFHASEMIKAIVRSWVCLPREHFSFMKVFNRVEGHPVIVERQFGMAIMDMRFAGREIKTFISLTEVVANLKNHFPELQDDLIENIILKGNSLIEKELHTFYDQIRWSLEISDASTEDRMYLADEDAFLYFNEDNIILTEDQELHLKAIAFSIKNFLEQKGEATAILNQYLFGSIENTKHMLVRLANEKFHMILTEQAWCWINELENADLVRILLVKLIMDELMGNKNEKNTTDIRKAMFENKMLTEKINRYMNDERVMETILEWSKQED